MAFGCKPFIVDADVVEGIVDVRGMFVIVELWGEGAKGIDMLGGSICGGKVDIGTSGVAKIEIRILI